MGSFKYARATHPNFCSWTGQSVLASVVVVSALGVIMLSVHRSDRRVHESRNTLLIWSEIDHCTLLMKNQQQILFLKEKP
jgi:hypothetical protein